MMASPGTAAADSELPRALSLIQADWERKVKIGGGLYAQVFELQPYLSIIPQCAAKVSFPVNTVTKSDFLNVCRLWSTLHHPNVVQFLGIYYPASEDETGLPVMVLEKMNGSVTIMCFPNI